MIFIFFIKGLFKENYSKKSFTQHLEQNGRASRQHKLI